ncbi:MAG: hypothetical protein FJ405_19405, partial [Verrucomicrobia bacterium]|nr:hypothetical protein [Verrucomicrobiota bacterium]
MKTQFSSIHVASILCFATLQNLPANFAGAVVSYAPGSAPSRYQNPSAALGAPDPISVSSGFTSPVSPFSPAFTPSQLVSIGAGGSLTLEMAALIDNNLSHPYGLDFIIFGNNGFEVGNFQDPEDQWRTDGALFNFDAPGSSTVWVSENNVDFFELKAPSGMASTVDGFYPTDASGNFLLPVKPLFKGDDFAGKNLAELREMYAGSAGGTGFDLDWAKQA